MASSSVPTLSPYTAVVAGSTGATGRRLVEVLSRSPNCKKVLALTRRPLGPFPDDNTDRSKVEEVTISDFEANTLGIQDATADNNPSQDNMSESPLFKALAKHKLTTAMLRPMEMEKILSHFLH